MNEIKFVYFGTPYVARDTLAILLEAGLRPALVVTSPDAPRGRGYELTPSETKVLALENNIPVITPEKLDEAAITEIKNTGAEVGIVVAYGKILPESLINIFPKGVLNIHYSLLPKYRGASPVESALLNNEAVTGVSIQKMVKKLDAGDVVAGLEEPIKENDNTTTLRSRLIEKGAELLIKILPKYLNDEITLVTQDESLVTYAPKFEKKDGELLDSDSDQTKWNKYRAYFEWPGTYFFENGKRIKVKLAKFENGKFQILRVVPEGKKEMDYPLK